VSSRQLAVDSKSVRRNPVNAARAVVVVNPRTLTGSAAQLWQRALDGLYDRVVICEEIRTAGAGADTDRVAQLVTAHAPQVVVAAGGDGTVRDVVEGVMRAAPTTAPSLALLPLGTANNVARSLGLRSVRQAGASAVDLAVATIVDGYERRIDLGHVDFGTNPSRYFVGSFAVGMDAEILRTRNQLRQRLRLRSRIGGYPLYLCSCAINLLRPHGTAARLRIDGPEQARRVYNLLVTNTPLYAGEFRFDAENSSDDGCIDLHVFAGPLDYLRRYPAAWRRHVRHARGERVQPPRHVQRVREVYIELSAPLAAQLDGEECAPVVSCTVRVVPQALAVRVPRIG